MSPFDFKTFFHSIIVICQHKNASKAAGHKTHPLRSINYAKSNKKAIHQ